MISNKKEFQFPPVGVENADVIEWLLLDAKLNMMGLNETERQIVLRTLSLNSEQPTIDITSFNQEVTWLYQTLDAVLPDQGDVQNRDEWLEIHQPLQAIYNSISQSQIPIAPSTLAQDFLGLANNTSYLTDDDDDKDYITKLPNGINTLREFRFRLQNLADSLSPIESVVAQANIKLDEFLSNDQSDMIAAGRYLASIDN